MPGNLQKKLKNIRQKEQAASHVPKSIIAEAEQADAFRQLGVTPMNNIDKVHIFMGEQCKEFTRAQFAGSSTTNVWAVKGQCNTIPSQSTKSEQQQKKSIEELMKIIQEQQQKVKADPKEGEDKKPEEKVETEEKADQ